MPRLWIMVICLITAISPITGCKGKQDAAAPSQDSTPKYTFRKDGELTVYGKDGSQKAKFNIEIADHDEAQQRGLKYRESMRDDEAMLFIFDGKQSYGFWMKDTYIPLDMLFIDYEQNIFQIDAHTTPFSEEPVEPEGYNKYTLEINAGLAEKMNITKGDRIEWTRTSSNSQR